MNHNSFRFSVFSQTENCLLTAENCLGGKSLWL
jgi:hypothetical protein